MVSIGGDDLAISALGSCDRRVLSLLIRILDVPSAHTEMLPLSHGLASTDKTSWSVHVVATLVGSLGRHLEWIAVGTLIVDVVGAKTVHRELLSALHLPQPLVVDIHGELLLQERASAKARSSTFDATHELARSYSLLPVVAHYLGLGSLLLGQVLQVHR